MKKLRLRLEGTFSREIREELYLLTMAGRWWLAYELSGDNPKVLEALFEDAEHAAGTEGFMTWQCSTMVQQLTGMNLDYMSTGISRTF